MNLTSNHYEHITLKLKKPYPLWNIFNAYLCNLFNMKHIFSTDQ